MRLIIVLPFLMALFSGGSAIFILSLKAPEFGLLQPTSAAVVPWLLLVMLLSAAAGLALAYGITAPLQELTSRLEKVAAGNFMQPLDMAAEQEIESLAQAFNSMMASMNRYILEGMAGAAIQLDVARRIVGFNPVAEIVFGCTQEEVVGRPVSQVVPDQPDNADFFALLDDALERGVGCTGRDLTVSTQKGEQIQMKMSVSLLKTGSEPGVGILANFKNLAEIQRVREQLHRADQLLTIGTMTAGIAHEIRNPLGSISGLLQLLREDLAADTEKTVYIDTIMRATDRINSLIEDLLTLANPALSSTESREINGILRETLGFVRFDELARKVEIVEEYDPAAPAVTMDSEKLGQAFLNIVRNALQATPQGGRITVSSRRQLRQTSAGSHKGSGSPGEYVQVRFNNTGSYIPPESRTQIFTPFYSTKREGSGLGLAITRQIILAHGGSIEVESEQEQGTTFIVDLPAAVRETAAVS